MGEKTEAIKAHSARVSSLAQTIHAQAAIIIAAVAVIVDSIIAERGPDEAFPTLAFCTAIGNVLLAVGAIITRVVEQRTIAIIRKHKDFTP